LRIRTRSLSRTVSAIAFHYYSVFLLIPFGVAELVRWARTDKADWPVLLAIGTSPLILLLHLPLISAARPFLAHHWAKASPAQAVSFYRVFGRLTPWCAGVLVIYVLWLLVPGRRSAKAEAYPGMPKHEWVACTALAVLPVVMVITAVATNGAFAVR
jgi:hypothetical protein